MSLAVTTMLGTGMLSSRSEAYSNRRASSYNEDDDNDYQPKRNERRSYSPQNYPYHPQNYPYQQIEVHTPMNTYEVKSGEFTHIIEADSFNYTSSGIVAFHVTPAGGDLEEVALFVNPQFVLLRDSA